MKRTTILIVLVLLTVLGAYAQEMKVQEQPAFTYAYLEGRGSYNQIPEVIRAFFDSFFKQGLTPRGPLVGVYLNDPRRVKEGELVWRMGVPVAPGTKVSAPLQVTESRAGAALFLLRKGPYETVEATYQEMFRYIDANGYRLVFPIVERYLNDPKTVKPEELLTEIIMPVEKK